MSASQTFSSLCEYPEFDAELGGLVGLLVGDAMGVAFEFHPPHKLPPRDQIDMIPPAGFSRSHSGVPPGTWSDDGAQALCLLDTAAADKRLAVAYGAARKKSSDENGLKTEQLRWMKEVRNKCTDAACLITAIDGRIATLANPS